MYLYEVDGMWKVCLAFVGQRSLLIIAAFLSINAHLAPDPHTKGMVALHPMSEIVVDFMKTLHELPEVVRVEQLTSQSLTKFSVLTASPYVWLAKLLVSITGISALGSLLLLSNLFFLLFLTEVYQLATRTAMEDTAVLAASLAVIWPSSYEMSLGASTVWVAFLMLVTLRRAVDGQWLISGITLGLLTLSDSVSLGLLPVLLYLFWYFQRHSPVSQVAQRSLCFIIPLAIAMYLRGLTFPSLRSLYAGSALAQITYLVANGQMGALFSRELGGQLITLICLLVGASVSLASGFGVVYRVIPLYTFLLLILYSPLTGIASRAFYAVSCLPSLASLCSPVLARVLVFFALLVGMYEVWAVFA